MNNSATNFAKKQSDTNTDSRSLLRNEYYNCIRYLQNEIPNGYNINYLYFKAKKAKRYYNYLSLSEKKDFLIKYKDIVKFYYLWQREFNGEIDENDLKNHLKELEEIQQIEVQLNQEINRFFLVIYVIIITALLAMVIFIGLL